MNWRTRICGHADVDPSKLIPHPHNFRSHPEHQAIATEGNIEDLGWIRSVIVNKRSGRIIDGHLRVELAVRKGEKTIPVEYVDLSESEEAQALATIDPLAALAETNKEALAAVLAQVDSSNDAVNRMLEELATEEGLTPEIEPGNGGDEFDTTPEESGPTRCKPGDLWKIGPHRLLCGDSTKAEDVKRLMGGKQASLCFTSPPYGQQRDYGDKAKEHVQDWNALMLGVFANLPMTDDGQVLVNLGLIHREGEWIPYWEHWIEWMRSQGWRRFGWYVWDQGSGLPGDWCGRLAPSFEFVWHFNRESIKPEKFVECKQAGKVHRNELLLKSAGHAKAYSGITQDTKIPDSVIRIHREQARTEFTKAHSAIFPIALPSFAMQSWPGDIYEPFGGSGTTLIAAQRLNRTAYLMEIEPKYCDVILRRCEAENLPVALIE